MRWRHAPGVGGDAVGRGACRSRTRLQPRDVAVLSAGWTFFGIRLDRVRSGENAGRQLDGLSVVPVAVLLAILLLPVLLALLLAVFLLAALLAILLLAVLFALPLGLASDMRRSLTARRRDLQLTGHGGGRGKAERYRAKREASNDDEIE